MKNEENENDEEENMIQNENLRASKISLGIFTNNFAENNRDGNRSSIVTDVRGLNLNRDDTTDYLTTPIMSESESNLKKRKKKTNVLALLLKNAFNIPFITGVIAIILTTIPFIKNQVKDPNSFISNYLIGNFLVFSCIFYLFN